MWLFQQRKNLPTYPHKRAGLQHLEPGSFLIIPQIHIFTHDAIDTIDIIDTIDVIDALEILEI